MGGYAINGLSVLRTDAVYQRVEKTGAGGLPAERVNRSYCDVYTMIVHLKRIGGYILCWSMGECELLVVMGLTSKQLSSCGDEAVGCYFL